MAVVRSGILPGLPTYLVQELNAGTVDESGGFCGASLPLTNSQFVVSRFQHESAAY